MITNYVRSISFLLMICVTFSCSKSSNNKIISCNASYSELGGLQQDGQVEYLAGITGTNGTKIATLQYQDSAGITTVKNPTLPWTKDVNLKKGSPVMISAITNANPGDTIAVSAFADGSQGGASCP
jgi:hypothetical protein